MCVLFGVVMGVQESGVGMDVMATYKDEITQVVSSQCNAPHQSIFYLLWDSLQRLMEMVLGKEVRHLK